MVEDEVVFSAKDGAAVDVAFATVGEADERAVGDDVVPSAGGALGLGVVAVATVGEADEKVLALGAAVVNVRIDVLGGDYTGCSWTGDLDDAPTTILIPEGIVSDRTVREAANMHDAIERSLEKREAIEIAAVNWCIRARRLS